MNTDEHGFGTWMLSHSLVIGPWTLVLAWVFGSLGVWVFLIPRYGFFTQSFHIFLPLITPLRALRLSCFCIFQFQPVPDAVDRFDPARIIGISFELAAKTDDVVVHCARGREGGVAPHNIEET